MVYLKRKKPAHRYEVNVLIRKMSSMHASLFAPLYDELYLTQTKQTNVLIPQFSIRKLT